jgi:hypothetical protein
MDPIKILAALVFKFRDESDEVVLTLADLNAALVGDRTNLSVRQADDGLHLKAIGAAEALAEQRAQAVKQPWRPPVTGPRRIGGG